ncbi:MAG TPA: hypothetical protein VMG34_03690 [Bacteroidota bacterium]|nr:hypothetical protein [Bacteroidota bacterium]
MFIGHIAVALGAKKAAPKVSLGTLVLAAQFVDLLWPLLLLLGLEHVRIEPGNTAFTPLDFYDYPISHSLLTGIGWGLAFALVFFIVRRSVANALILAACVVSHWVLDFVSHRPDLPIVPGLGMKVGLGLWNSVPATIIVEGLLFAGGVYLYVRSTHAKDKTGTYAFWSLIVFLFLVWVANMLGGAPPSVEAIAWAGQAMWLLVIWAYWADRHRAAGNMTGVPQ